MERRVFISGITVGLLAAPLAAEAQPRSRVARVAFLDGGNLESHLWQATRDGLREPGYVGQNLIIEFRSAEGQFERLPALLAELIRVHVDVIVTIGDPVVSAAKQATSTIPIVMAGAGDPRRSRIRREPGPAGRQHNECIESSRCADRQMA